MKKLFAILLLTTLLYSCKKTNQSTDEVCPGGCNVSYNISGGVLQSDGYWHVPHSGPNYFKVKGTLSELNSKYIINGVPLIEANFDSDYWVLFDSIQYTTPMYSYLGWYTNNQFTTPINIGGYTYTLQGLANIHSPLNIAGYQLNPNMCWTCPYTPTLFGTHSKYNYHPQQNMFFDNEMIGDTANIYIETIFNSDVGPRETVNTVLKVIFE
jgi:hypothetical protein